MDHKGRSANGPQGTERMYLQAPSISSGQRTAGGSMRSTHRKSRTGCRECKQRHRKCDESVPICLNCSIAGRPCSYRFSRPTYRIRFGPQLATPASSPPLTPAASADSIDSSTEQESTKSPSSSSICTTTPTTTTASTSSTTNSSTTTTTITSTTAITACSTPARSSLAPSLPPAPPEVIDVDIDVQRWQPHFYTMDQLELLHNLSSNVMRDADMLLLPMPVCSVIMQHALGTPYLMDQMLALSAAHMSFVRPSHEQRKAYRNKAMLLQTRALTSFNRAGTGLYAQNGCSWFLYASLLGLQVMFETFQSKSFDGFLSELATYLTVHRGVQTVVRQTWDAIKDVVRQITEHWPRSWLGGLRLEDGRLRECGALTELINQSDLREEEREACHEIIERLQWLYDMYRFEPHGSKVHFIIAWTITMPAGFADLLKNRRPEALVIFAFYAVLLHRSRWFWVFGSSGRFLIESIAEYLGESWEPWFIFPKEQLEAT